VSERNELQEWIDSGREATRKFALIGKGKALHLSTGNDETLCGRLMMDGSRYVGVHDTDNAPCAACWRVMLAALAAPAMLPTAATEIDTDSTTDPKGVAEMATTKTTANDETNAKLREEIEANIERMASLVEAENVDGAQELKKETDTLVAKLPARERNPLRQKMTAAVTVQEVPTPAVPAPSTEVATLPKDFTEIAGVNPLVDQAAAKVREAAATAYGAGKEIARMLLDIRLNIPKDGVPDLQADLDQSKKASTAVYTRVTEGLPAEGTDEAADVIRAGVDSVKKSAQNAMVDVRVEYLRALDHSPEEAKRFSKLIDAAKEVDGKKPSASEVVAKHFGITLQTRAEIAKANREKKALVEKAQNKLDTAAAKLGQLTDEVERKLEAGEMTEDEMNEALAPANEAVAEAQKELAAASGPAETGKEKTPTEILIDHVKKMEKLSKEVDAKGVEGLDEKQKKATRAKLEAIRDTVKNLLSEI
jgi:hypothetical protein